ncbi:MAG: AAA family ATPase [Candidatus Binataceae bacterium]
MRFSGGDKLTNMKMVEAAREFHGYGDTGEQLLMRIIQQETRPLHAKFEVAIALDGLVYRVEQDVGLSADLAPEELEDRVLYWTESATMKEVLLKRGNDQTGSLIRLERVSNGRLEIEVAARQLREAHVVLAEFVTRFERKPEETGTPRVSVSFWRDSSPSPDSNERYLDAVRWTDIASNYNAATGTKLGLLMALNAENLKGGRLMLWHGRPGTGKTYALRALAYEWKSWCDIHYITDPEAMLGRAGYLLHMLLDENADDERWRLLVMEDTGELLSIDARQNVGQALSRLLNTTEGLIGQGLRVLFLITTNEESGKLNPAVTRPGRCLSAVEFNTLTREEARVWLAHAGVATEPKSSLTLSELYALTRGERQNSSNHHVGFRAGD